MDKSPDAFRTISEVSELLETPAHVLRFWETRFPQIKPVKRAGGRRYYRPADVTLLSGIRKLLHDEGMTIRGVQKILREQGVRHVAGLSGSDTDTEFTEMTDALEGALDAVFDTPEGADAPQVGAEVVSLSDWVEVTEITESLSALRDGAEPEPKAERPPPAAPAPPLQGSLFDMAEAPPSEDPHPVQEPATIAEQPPVTPEPAPEPAVVAEAVAEEPEVEQPSPEPVQQAATMAEPPEAELPATAPAPESPPDDAPARADARARGPVPESVWIAASLRALPPAQWPQKATELRPFLPRLTALRARLGETKAPRRG